ncbi:alpha/beta fold hydrolase BchO [Aliiroseovarius sp. YM-037]|uniref:alpha/beta fold hydrolase BchO n=1 Tax=Aliiroseovarius sp. YM-037 TaxID=3341728 RepID=UPI003A7FBEF1
MRWPEHAENWPLTEHSRLVLHRPHRWHVQEAGVGPTLLLIHGAGGATQSWRGLFPILAKTYHVVAIDLPGQGFTQLGARGRCGLDQVAEDLLSLSADQGWHPDAIIGHSAGAAIALRMTEALGDAPPAVIGINAALGNFKGVAGWLFPMLARLLSLSPFSADLFIATSSSPRNVRKLIAGTGSKIDADGLALYQRLASDRAHVDATLAMMAQWSLDGLLSRLDQLKAQTLFIVGESDSAVPPNTSAEAAAKIPKAKVIRLTGLGHLAHEEAPQMIADRITAWWSEAQQ